MNTHLYHNARVTVTSVNSAAMQKAQADKEDAME